ncbi:MAG: histidinol phosphate phosphatase domain-containing protein [Desulfuromonadales bacterium]
MIDLHVHSLFSDGELIPSELTRRAAVIGYRALAITDHADQSNVDFIIPRICAVAEELGRDWGLTVIPGIELTHVPPHRIAGALQHARDLGARLVVCHGETIVEPVAPGTNRAAIEAGVDILSHPGLITAEEADLAAQLGVCLEITARKGHCLTNGHVARLAVGQGAPLVVNTDSHAPGDLIELEMARKIAIGAGLSEEQFEQCRRNSEELVKKATASPLPNQHRGRT